ncbi:MAG: hypothetical protein GX225_07735 [Clostridiales bacterium]|nr:hypothetical protein [Clostridiales bacterium]
MIISGMNNISDIYNSTVSRNIPRVSPENVSANADVASQTTKESPSGADNSKLTVSSVDGTVTRKLLPTDEVASYAQNVDLSIDIDLIGSESDILKLDVEKAVSEMKKDSILQEYQFFVSNLSTEDGIVIRK